MLSASVSKKLLAGILCLGLLALLAPRARAADANADAPMFTLLPEFTPEQIAQPAWIRAKVYQPLMISMDAVGKTLADAPLEDTPKAAVPLIVFLPTPEGVFQRFAVVEAPIMEPALAAQFPDIKTFRGQGIDDPWATLRMDHTPQGFHAQVLTPTGKGSWYIDPFTDRDTVLHTSYYKQDLRRTIPWTCDVHGQAFSMRAGDGGGTAQRTSGTSLRTLRLAVAATVEYTAFHGGTVALGQAAIVTAINRVTGVYEREVAIRMVLVANNSSLVYAAAPDPYTNGNGEAMLTENQTNITSIIGSANYDIGHVFSTGGGGIAGLGVVCVGNSKAEGVTGSTAPTGDPFWIDYVAHEMGHQFDGNHTFNGTGGSCAGGNRNASTAYEPGSGSTIQAYAGICGADDLQNNSDAYFHTISYNEIRNIESASTCGTSSSTGNTAPTVNAGADYTIPKQTPFTLTAVGSDANGDALTYCWEELALGGAQTLAAADNGASTLIRSLSPTTSPSRTVPKLSTILSNIADPEEELPTLARTTWNWRCTVRDNRSGGGGVNEDNIVLTVSSASGPFLVTYPNTTVSIGGPITVTWNVANTSAAPVNCANVKISLSTDSGNTFPTVLAASTPNDGSETVTLPSITTSTARIKIEAVGNIFFDISNANFSIFPVAPAAVFVSGGSNTATDSSGNGNANGIVEPGESAIALTIPLKNAGSLTGTGVSGTLTSLTATASVVSGVSAYPDLAFNAVGTNAMPLVIAISPSHPCGAAVNLRLSMSSAQGSSVIDFSLPTGSGGGAVTQTFSWTGTVAITDGATAGVNVPVVVSGLGTITDVNFRFDGSSCSTSVASTTVGLSHNHVGDLIVKLTSPQGTAVTMINRPGAGSSGTSGNNFCQTLLDDESTGTSIDAITSAGNPYSNSYLPQAALSAFDGQNPNGTWTLNVADVLVTDAGTLRAFSIIITAASTPTCQPPLTAAGACCLNATGACVTTTGAGACAGSYRGDGTTCPPTPACQQPSTCCHADGSCTVVPVGSFCSGGSPRADSTCPPTTACVQPFACCAGDGSCTVISPGEPCDGTPASGSTCPPSPACPHPTTCCLVDGSCTVIAIGGTCNGFARPDSTCPPTTPCVQPFACCAADGTCSVIPPGGTCGGTTASGATCPPAPACPQPTTCCLANGSCTVINVGGTCSGTVGGGSTCPPAMPCPPASGACCTADGSCSVLTVPDCNAVSGGGAYQGDGIACTPTLCPQPVVGACCQTDGSCLPTTEAQCTVGVWSNITCTPTVCPQPTGACCQADGSCLPITQVACSVGAWSSGVCSPNSCPQPQGTCCVAGGSCSLTTEAACSTGTWNSAGTSCDPNPCPQPAQNCCRGTTCVAIPAGSCTGSVAGSASVVFASCGSGTSLAACCYADFDHNGTASIDDLFLYFNAYFVGSPYARYGGNGVASPAIDDLFLYMNAYFTGCTP